jgi:hypothetical protein
MPRTAPIALLVPLLLAALAAPCRAQTGALPPEEPGIPPGYQPMPAAEAAAVRAVLQGYLDAVQRHDGAAAARAVTRETRAYYARMRDLAMTAPEAKVRALSLMDRLSVLMYRHRVPADVLRTLTGDAAFAHTVSDGWVARTANWQPSATAEVFGNGDRALLKDAGSIVHMVREEGAWRWDMMPIIRTASTQFAANLPAGMTEDDFILFVLSNSTGRPASPTVWQPVQ